MPYAGPYLTMEQRFVPLNAVIGMYSTTKTSWPRPFHDAGYRLQALEFPIRLDDVSSIVADAIGYNAENRFALHESKSGTAFRDFVRTPFALPLSDRFEPSGFGDGVPFLKAG